ncbi:MAG: NmrA family NAD(P)-binding protein [Bacillota bacterium]
MVLVTGAAGKTGKAVIKALHQRGVSVKAWVRNSSQIELAKARGAKEVVVGDMQETNLYKKAVRGVTAIYHICPNLYPYEIQLGQLALQAALEVADIHFVYHSVLHPQTEKMPHHWQKLRVEEMIFEAELDFTILQPSAYMQNILTNRKAITEEGVYRIPYPVETRLSMVDLNDVAEVAAIVLTESSHRGAIYELAGAEALTQLEVADILSSVCNYPVAVEQQSISDWKQKASEAGLGDYQIEALNKMFDYYACFGLPGNANVLRWILNRKPTKFKAFAEREFPA